MKSKKAIALIISLTLIVSMTLPGTLAVSEDQAAVLDSYTLAEEEPAVPTSEEEQQEQEKQEAPENQENQENQKNQGEQQQTAKNPTEGEKTCTCGGIDGVHAVDCPLYTAPEAPAEGEKTCTCGTTDGTHTEDCPLYTAPKEPAGEEKTCTCEPKPAEGEPHKKGCPLYVEQAEPTEKEVEIKYQVVGPENSGTLDPASETLLLPVSGTETGSADENQSGCDAELYLAGAGYTAAGSTPTAAEGFVFVGWYSDEACTQPVETSWVSNNKLVPGKTKNYGTAESPVMGYEAATYYAKFAIDAADLTITRQGQDIDEGQSFIFDVAGPDGYNKRVAISGSGSVTIKGLKTGTYTVTEVTAWSWRHTACGVQSVTLQPAQTGTADFTNAISNGEWLSGAYYSKITFKS